MDLFDELDGLNSISDVTANSDIELLASKVFNVDSLIQQIQRQNGEITNLKSKLKSLNESAVQVKNVFSLESEKCMKLEIKNSALTSKIELLEQQLNMMQHEQINSKTLHEQIVAKLEQTIEHQPEYINLCKHFIKQGNILIENNLTNSTLNHQYSLAKEYLQSKCERFESTPAKKKVCKKKYKTMSTMTDAVPEVPAKLFRDSSTMHFQTTATRGTNTAGFFKTTSVATMFPEPISIEEIFAEIIFDVPALLSPIQEFRWPTNSTTTQTECLSAPMKNVTIETCDAGTNTDIKNVRKAVGYTRKVKLSSGRNTPNGLFSIKKEEEHVPNTPINNLAFPILGAGNIPINPQLSNLWQILGQTIFSLIGTGRVFDNDADSLNLINHNLHKIQHIFQPLNANSNSNASSSGEVVNNIKNTSIIEDTKKVNREKCFSECSEDNYQSNKTNLFNSHAADCENSETIVIGNFC